MTFLTPRVCAIAPALMITVGLSLAICLDAYAAGGDFQPPSDTPATGTVINSYASVSSIFGKNIYLDSALGFSAGDRALLIQMKGATVDRTDTATHGDITNYLSAGLFEFVEIDAVAGNTVVLASSPTVLFQPSSVVQLVRVEKYTDKTLTGTISALPWDGEKGGGGGN